MGPDILVPRILMRKRTVGWGQMCKYVLSLSNEVVFCKICNEYI